MAARKNPVMNLVRGREIKFGNNTCTEAETLTDTSLSRGHNMGHASLSQKQEVTGPPQSLLVNGSHSRDWDRPAPVSPFPPSAGCCSGSAGLPPYPSLPFRPFSHVPVPVRAGSGPPPDLCRALSSRRRWLPWPSPTASLPLRLPPSLWPPAFLDLSCSAMENGSPSRRSWEDEADDELPSPRSLGVGSPGLFPGAAAFGESPSPLELEFGHGDRIFFSDSEDYSDSEPPSPPPEGKGKAVAAAVGRRRRTRRHRRRWQEQGFSGFMAAARRAHPTLESVPIEAPPRCRASHVGHPPRAFEELDADGFYRVRSRHRWRRRSPLKQAKPVPPALVGLCFNCLADNHVKADCTFQRGASTAGAAEDELGLALVACVGGTRPSVSPAIVRQFLSDCFRMGIEDAKVLGHDPKDFVVRFRRREDRDRVLHTQAPHVLDPVVKAELPGLRYLVRIRLVAFQDWNTPPVFPRGGDHGGGADKDDGSDDSNHNRYHPGLDGNRGGASRGLYPDVDDCGGSADDDVDSGDSNYNRYHPGVDSLAVDGAEVLDRPADGDLLAGCLDVLVGTVHCPIWESMAGRCGGFGAVVTVESASPVVDDVASSAYVVGSSEEPRLIEQPLRPSSMANDALCDDDISLIGRHAEYIGEPGFLGRFLCEDPSLLVGSFDRPSDPVAACTPESACLGPACQLVGGLERVDSEELREVFDVGPTGEALTEHCPALGRVVGPDPVPLHGEDAPRSAPRTPLASGTPPLLVDCLEDRLCLPLRTPLVRGPPRLRRPRTPAHVQSLRRSERIAATPREADSTKQAQLVLMQKLGMAAPSPAVDSETVRKYKTTFREPLSESNQEALQLLFGGQFDPVAMNLNMLGLDEEAI
ncbi:unnamed protein product [Miscanthus lutarioriparius]|uniref:Uncharacterized protein n=1 Tax=Miscanthus lutarioriparius TaxID=422564 RepID=A0A811RN02_9POAL|nr:unnamed protein product [Miscanthus lutarioriparius]